MHEILQRSGRLKWVWYKLGRVGEDVGEVKQELRRVHGHVEMLNKEITLK